MRKIDPETGIPFQRKRPVNWQFVRSTLAFRREMQRMKRAGYVARRMFNEQLGSDMGKRIVDAVPSADGRILFLKIEGGNAPEADYSAQDRAWWQERQSAARLPSWFIAPS